MPALEESASERGSGAARSGAYAKVAPSAALSPFVKHIRLVPPTQHEGSYVRLPDGQMELVLQSSSESDWLNVVGTRSRVLRKSSGPSDAFCVVVRFKAGGGYPFFGMPVSELTDQMVDLEQLWGAQCAELQDALGDASEPLGCLAATERALYERLHGPKLYEPSSAAGVRKAVRLIEHSMIVPEVDALARELGVSARQLRRAFAEVVGLSPKQYLRVVRFQRARRLSLREESLSWSQIASAVGYFDQAHMINEFRVLCGQTPAELSRRADASTSRRGERFF
jgi:AraC-like DNA-binding protein